MNIIARPKYLELLTSKIDNKMIKVITGIRRSGKSFLLFNLFYNYLISHGVKDDQIIKISFDSLENEELLDLKKLNDYLIEKTTNKKKRYYIMLDEVQFLITAEELKNRDKYLRLYALLNGLLQKENVDIYVTGSNSKLLSRDVLTEFRGRGDNIHIAPLSFSEYFPAHGGTKYDAWNDYLLYGGMPHILELKNETEKINYLMSLNKEIFLKDICERYNISNESALEELEQVLASQIGSLVNPQKILNTFSSSGHKSLSAPTIKSYLTYFEESFIVQKALRYNVKGRKYISTPSKYYYSDVGLRNAILGLRQIEATHLMENIIYNELVYRGFLVDVGVVEVTKIENQKGIKRQYEIDFIANLGSKKYYIQSAYALPDKEKMEQEQFPLVNVHDSFKKIIVLGTNSPVWRNEKGIMIINILDFLINENSLDM